MSAPSWAIALLRRLAPPGRAEDVLGDLEEAHQKRLGRRGRVTADILTSLEALDMAHTLMRARSNCRRAARGRSLAVSWLDFKLGFRMLLRYPGLTVVGGLAIAFSVCVGAGTFEFLDQVASPALPLDGGDRIVGIQLTDRASAGVERRALHDFMTWREELRSVHDLGAFQILSRNLITGEGRGEPMEVAEISASAFRVAGVPPLIGRTLNVADERAGAPPVVVLGYDVWQSRLGGDPTVVGRTVRLGSDEATVVGVMPEGYAFPISQSLWAPLKLSAAGYEPREGPAIRVFGRLAPGVTLEEAQAELTTLGLRGAADFPETHERLSPQVMPFALTVVNLVGSASLVTLSINVFAALLLVLACGNVALLLFARAASRESELVVRSALGASRGRIVTQLLAEALVLGSLAAVAGVAAARFALRWWLSAVGVLFGDMPFWFRDVLSPGTLLYAAGLTVLGAVVAGVMPGLKVTSGLHSGLKQATQGGGGPRFGGVWTAVIVTQVAVTVAVPVFAFFVRRDAAQIESREVGFPEQEFLSAKLEMDRDPQLSDTAFLGRFDASVVELEERLALHPAVSGVTVASSLPRMYHPHRLIEVEGGAAPLIPMERQGEGANCTGACAGYRVSAASVDRDFFKVLDAPILSGRGFRPGDFAAGPGPVIVNQSFVDRVMGGRNPLGRRIRYTYLEESGAGASETELGPWHEIVGVVRDMAMAVEPDPKVAGVYHPLTSSGAYPLHIAVHVRGEAKAFGPRLRSIALRVDPTLRLGNMLPLDAVDDADLRFYRFWFWLVVMVSSVAMLLSMAGIYSVMAFIVSRRTREIGIRVALGSSPARIAVAIFRRPLTQVAIGVAAGAVLAGLLSYAILRGGLWPVGALVVAAYAALMMGVCLVACVVPTRRALRIEPTEALRADA